MATATGSRNGPNRTTRMPVTNDAIVAWMEIFHLRLTMVTAMRAESMTTVITMSP